MKVINFYISLRTLPLFKRICSSRGILFSIVLRDLVTFLISRSVPKAQWPIEVHELVVRAEHGEHPLFHVLNSQLELRPELLGCASFDN